MHLIAFSRGLRHLDADLGKSGVESVSSP